MRRLQRGGLCRRVRRERLRLVCRGLVFNKRVVDLHNVRRRLLPGQHWGRDVQLVSGGGFFRRGSVRVRLLPHGYLRRQLRLPHVPLVFGGDLLGELRADGVHLVLAGPLSAQLGVLELRRVFPGLLRPLGRALVQRLRRRPVRRGGLREPVSRLRRHRVRPRGVDGVHRVRGRPLLRRRLCPLHDELRQGLLLVPDELRHVRRGKGVGCNKRAHLGSVPGLPLGPVLRTGGGQLLPVLRGHGAALRVLGKLRPLRPGPVPAPDGRPELPPVLGGHLRIG